MPTKLPACAPHAGLAAAIYLGVAPLASAYEFRCRFVERIGNIDVPLENDTLDASDRGPRNIRLQFGVFDDAVSDAPAGGFVGMLLGGIRVNGASENSDETRTPGRLAPFNLSRSPRANGVPPLPLGDPFTMLTDIDATLAPYAAHWFCDASGEPLPMPGPVIHGRNTFVSLYAITIDPSEMAVSYTIDYTGELSAATTWRLYGNPIPPDCENGVPGVVNYFPSRLQDQPFSRTLNVMVPSPLAGPLFAAASVAWIGRRRRSSANRSM